MSSNQQRYPSNSRRIASNHSVSSDQSYTSQYDTTHIHGTRTISSSSASIMSTPSNNIRRFQQQRQLNRNNHLPKDNSLHIEKKSNNGKLIKNKLLNLQGSQRKYLSVNENHPNKSTQGFILHKPIDMSIYDYSIFTNYPNGVDLQHSNNLPPAVKESQVKAWESAEKVSKKLIFDNSNDFSDNEDGENLLVENKPQDEALNEIESIPGYTNGELKIILELFRENQRKGYNKFREDEERKFLWEYRQNHQESQEHLFLQYSSLSGKRKVQLSQKKDLLHKLFGYGNNVNQEYITNNTSYSSLDNVSSTQKVFHEDKEEIGQLLDEDKAYNIYLEETREALRSNKSSSLNAGFNRKSKKQTESLTGGNFDYDKYQHLAHKNLDVIYDEYLSNYDARSPQIEFSCNDKFENTEEFQSLTMSFLRQRLKEESGNEVINNETV